MKIIVGFSRDGDPRDGYAAIHIGGRTQVAIRRFAYDVETTIRDAASAGFSGVFADRLRRGR